jgi:hypothetical protein
MMTSEVTRDESKNAIRDRTHGRHMPRAHVELHVPRRARRVAAAT